MKIYTVKQELIWKERNGRIMDHYHGAFVVREKSVLRETAKFWVVRQGRFGREMKSSDDFTNLAEAKAGCRRRNEARRKILLAELHAIDAKLRRAA